MSKIERLEEELAEAKAIICSVADAFEQEMDSWLACDERHAVAKCREAAEAARKEVK